MAYGRTALALLGCFYAIISAQVQTLSLFQVALEFPVVIHKVLPH